MSIGEREGKNIKKSNLLQLGRPLGLCVYAGT